jgi:hypothetical protein
VLLILTAHLAWRGKRLVALTATATATMLLVDGWFDLMTSPRGVDLTGTVIAAVFGEVPLALLCLWIAVHLDRVVARRLRVLAWRAERAQAGGGWVARLRARRPGRRPKCRGGGTRGRGRHPGRGVGCAGGRGGGTGGRGGVRAAEAPDESLVERPDGDPGTG